MNQNPEKERKAKENGAKPQETAGTKGFIVNTRKDKTHGVTRCNQGESDSVKRSRAPRTRIALRMNESR